MHCQAPQEPQVTVAHDSQQIMKQTSTDRYQVAERPTWQQPFSLCKCSMCNQYRAHLVLMFVKGVEALCTLHTPQLQQAVGAAGQQLHSGGHDWYDGRADIPEAPEAVQQVPEKAQVVCSVQAQDTQGTARSVTKRVKMQCAGGHQLTCVPADRKLRRSTEAVWPSKVFRQLPSDSVHRRNVLSPVAQPCLMEGHTKAPGCGHRLHGANCCRPSRTTALGAL